MILRVPSNEMMKNLLPMFLKIKHDHYTNINKYFTPTQAARLQSENDSAHFIHISQERDIIQNHTQQCY